MNLFRRKSATKAPRDATTHTADTLKKLRDQLESLEKREQHLSKKIELQFAEAKRKSAAKDKRGAIFALKRKKMYESEIEKLQGARMTLETQVMTLESAHVNMETFQAMRSGATQMKSIHGQMSVDTVDTIMDDIQEEMATADEISRAISQPIGSELYDDDELEAELEAMEALEIGEEKKVDVAPSQVAAVTPSYNLPEAPTHAVERAIPLSNLDDEDELEALRKLEASMAL